MFLFEYIEDTLNILFEQNQIELVEVIKLEWRIWEEITKQRSVVVGNHSLSSQKTSGTGLDKTVSLATIWQQVNQKLSICHHELDDTKPLAL